MTVWFRLLNADCPAGSRQALFDAQNGICHYCSVEMTMDVDLLTTCTRDHIQPLGRGGRDAPENVVGACNACNNARGQMDYAGFVVLARLLGHQGIVERFHTPLPRYGSDVNVALGTVMVAVANKIQRLARGVPDVTGRSKGRARAKDRARLVYRDPGQAVTLADVWPTA